MQLFVLSSKTKPNQVSSAVFIYYFVFIYYVYYKTIKIWIKLILNVKDETFKRKRLESNIQMTKHNTKSQYFSLLQGKLWIIFLAEALTKVAFT